MTVNDIKALIERRIQAAKYNLEGATEQNKNEQVIWYTAQISAYKELLTSIR